MDDAAIVKYNSTGVAQWTTTWDGPLSGGGATAIWRDSAGNIYATGWSTGLDDNADVLALKLNSGGGIAWTARYAGPANVYDIGTRVMADKDGNVRVLAQSSSGGSAYDIVTVGYTSAGAEQFVNRFDTGGGTSNIPGGMAIDGAGYVYVSGAAGSDCVTLKYNGTSEVWRRIENTGAGDAATALGIDDSGYVYVTGRGGWGANAFDFTTIKYTQNAGIEETSNAEVRAPNGESSIVRGVLRIGNRGQSAEDRARLLDASGRRVMALRVGANDVSRVAPGVYFVAAASQPPLRVVIQQ